MEQSLGNNEAGLHSFNIVTIQTEDSKPDENVAKTSCVNWPRVRRKLIQHYLTLGFMFVLFIGLVFPTPGEKVKSWKLRDYGIVDTINVSTIFIISGLNLKTEDLVAALTAYKGLAYGLFSILILTPCLGFGLIKLPLNPNEFALGLAIFAAVPTTLTSGVTLVTQAYGNGTLALLLTVGSNLLGILTVPFAVRWIVASGTHVNINAIELLIKLALTIMLPLFIGKTIRELSSRVEAFAENNRVTLSLISSSSLICLVWQTLSDSRDKILDQDATDILLIILAGTVLHLILLLVNLLAMKLLSLEKKEWKAVLILSSEKTLPVAVTVISYLKESEVGDLKLITIPCIVGHISQLFIDAFIVSRWAAQYLKENPSETH